MVLDLTFLPSQSLKKMVLADISEYDDTRSLAVNLEVTPPGFRKINVEFVQSSINILDSERLGISCGRFVNLPDGIYKFKFSVPSKDEWIEKTYLRVDHLQCKYGKVLLSLHLDDDCYDKSQLKKIGEIRTLIEGAVSAANNCDPDLANTLYNKANNLLDRIKKCNCNG